MPKGPQGQKRPADVVGNAVHVMQIATGEREEEFEDDGKDPAAKELGAKGGKASSPLKKASLTGFHATAKHIAAKAVSPSSETMRTI